MEESSSHVEIRTAITANWLMALEYLKDTGRVKSDRKFEEETGIRGQRISEMRKFIETGERSSYVPVDYVVVLNEMFGVSFDYIMKGEKPVMIQNKATDSDNPLQDIEKNSPVWLQKINLELEKLGNNMELFEKKLAFIEKRID